MPSRREQRADPAVRRVERGERDAGDRGRQREGQVDQGVDELRPGKAVAHQHPGDEQAEDASRPAPRANETPKLSRSALATRGSVATRQMPAEPEARRPRDQRGERQQHDQAEVEQRVAERQPEARDDARLSEGPLRTRRSTMVLSLMAGLAVVWSKTPPSSKCRFWASFQAALQVLDLVAA